MDDATTALLTYGGFTPQAFEIVVSGSVHTDSTGNTDHTYVRLVEVSGVITGTPKRYASGRATGATTSDIGFTTVGFGLFNNGDTIQLELAKDFVGTCVLDNIMIAITPI